MIQSFRMAIKSIASNKTRAFLTMLGIIIGVMALVILVSLVNGATGTVTDTIEELGSDSITVTVSDNKGNPVTLDDIDEWMENESFSRIAPYAAASATGKVGDESESVYLYGTTAAYLDVENLSLMVGRFLKTADVDNASYVCVLTEGTAEELIGYADCIGSEISFNGTRFTVVGVLEDEEDTISSILTSGTMMAYIPYTTLVRFSSTQDEEITTFSILPASDVTVDEAEDIVTELMNERFEEDEDAYSISSSSLLEDTMDDITSVFEILLGGIAAISLIVGGIGIMNIMLVTVTERTREIGIRKAVGASRGAILLQFLVEAVVLCMFGCAIGIGCSWVILKVFSIVVSSINMNFAMDGNVVLASVIFCFAIGVGFGLYPANKAAKMKPIDALHFGG